MTEKYKHEFLIQQGVDGPVVSFAGKVLNRCHFMRDAGQCLSLMGVRGHPKEANKEFTERYGLTPSAFKRVFNGVMRGAWIEPIEKHALRYAFSLGGRVKPEKLSQIWRAKDKIEQCEKDGIENIIPFVLCQNKTPEQLKLQYGKGLWKVFCKQSRTRNFLLSKQIGRGPELATFGVQLPSYVLKRGLQLTDASVWLYKTGTLSAKMADRDFNGACQIHDDTRRMARQLGATFSSKWSLEKMYAKHSEYVDRINIKKYSPEPFDHLKDFKVRQVEHNGYMATLLDSPALILKEGEVMHHCVGAYVSSVKDGTYLVYSITKDGVKTSTLGVDVQTPRRVAGRQMEGYTMNQCYGKCNSQVVDFDEKMLVERVIGRLNNMSGECE